MTQHSNRLEVLVQQHGNHLYRASLAILGNVAEAEDAVQETYLKFLTADPELRDENHARAWLLHVLANLCKSTLRRRKRRPTEELLDCYPAPDPETRDLVEAIQELPANQRASVHLFYYEGYSTEEIASILGQRPGTIRSHLSRAREALRQKLKGGF